MPFKKFWPQSTAAVKVNESSQSQRMLLSLGLMWRRSSEWHVGHVGRVGKWACGACESA